MFYSITFPLNLVCNSTVVNNFIYFLLFLKSITFRYLDFVFFKRNVNICNGIQSLPYPEKQKKEQKTGNMPECTYVRLAEKRQPLPTG